MTAESNKHSAPEQPNTLWETRGWTQIPKQDRTIYTGNYCVSDAKGTQRSFEGRIEMRPRKGYQIKNGKLQFNDIVDIEEATIFIINPPVEIKDHPHGLCFRQIGIADGKTVFRLNFWSPPPSDVDTAIAYMEQLLSETFNPELLQRD